MPSNMWCKCHNCNYHVDFLSGLPVQPETSQGLSYKPNLSTLGQVMVVFILKQMYNIPYFSTCSPAKEYTIIFTVNLKALSTA